MMQSSQASKLVHLPLSESSETSTFQSLNTAGLYPAGEGAGYAGGILSAAVDGLKVAEAVAISLVKKELDALHLAL